MHVYNVDLCMWTYVLHLSRWIDLTWGGVTQLRTAILQDFFRFAFDGSGADNFFDAGSCIDGRLTSAWNWCSQVSGEW